ncbi:MAG TPA: SRPBCC domain-containing protein [Blastocatellia bacterium]|nr:SRPBCC domain-containing protein [Blastocatellia bacterium]
MSDIFQHFPIKAPARQVFDAVSTPAGLSAWWTETTSGKPEQGAEYDLGFGPGYDWRATVSRCVPGQEFELELTRADQDWEGTRLGFQLDEIDGVTQVRFHHTGWPESNEHYRVSCYCWSMYLRLLKRFVERGEVVPYEDRLDA